ncbi:MAG TPA: type 1 fimbrial protein [Pantoea sp.]|uniref:fimbrial protein n=1 Tax=Pantoea TaxID=53335 RepID=UPI000BB57464|nr:MULTISPECIES: fimbrial protein [Pantoea]PNK62979.1 type 1 fimbrial protein [Pantoea sp. FDAARGOS_194]HAK36590.1 type 1 fimbrial protein [Pantoea sp.]
MKIKNSVLPVFLAGLMTSGAAFATPTDGASPMHTNPGAEAGTQGAGGEVKFTGEITDVSCEISAASKSQTVDLGKWAKSYFESRTETTQTPFKISVKNCPQSVASVAVLFDGDKDSSDSTLLKTTGTATGVGIKLYESDRATPVAIGSISKPVSVTAGSGKDGGSADLNFFADYKSDGAAIAAGPANATSNFVMVYN